MMIKRSMNIFLLAAFLLFSAQACLGAPPRQLPAGNLPAGLKPASISSTATPVEYYQWLSQWGGNLATGVHFNQPLGICLDGSNYFYVADKNNKRVIKINSNSLDYSAIWTSYSTFTRTDPDTVKEVKNNFSFPTSLAVGPAAGAPAPRLFLADLNQVASYNPVQDRWELWGYKPSAAVNDSNLIATATSVAYDPSANCVYITIKNSLRRYDADLNITANWKNPNDITSPVYIVPHLAVDLSGYVYFSDSAAKLIRKFSSDLVNIQNFNASGAGGFGSSGPAGLAVDPDGNIFAADPDKNRVLKLSNSGQLITIITGSDIASPKGLNRPTSVAVNRDGLLFVSDTGNNRVQAFEKRMVVPASTTTTTMKPRPILPRTIIRPKAR